MARSFALYTLLTLSLALLFSMQLNEKIESRVDGQYLRNVKDEKKGRKKKNAQARKKQGEGAAKKAEGNNKPKKKKAGEKKKEEAKKPARKRKKAESDNNQPSSRDLMTQNKHHLRDLKQPEKLSMAEHDRTHRHSQGEIDRAAREIDRIIVEALKSNQQSMNPRTKDHQFVRRVYLDAAGRIPTENETLAFLNNQSALKRQELINDLLLKPDYPSQMFNWLAEMLRVMDVNGLKGNTSGYQAWLMDQIGTNRPWNEMVRDMLTVEGNLVTDPASGWLLRDRGMPLDSLSNTLTTFMGANVACAQCHDHPFDDWSQKDFYELAAFFGATEVPDQDTRKIRPSGQKNRTLSMLIAPHVARVTTREKKFLSFPEDYAYDDAKPGSKVTPNFPVMDHLINSKHFSDPSQYRVVFADWLTHQDNEQFAATIANRLWRKALGRAVMEPLTEMDNLDQASNPKLIRKLAEIMRRLGFDLMAFQRVIYNTQSYMAQASIEPPMGETYRYPGPLLRRMTAEQAWDSLLTLVIGSEKLNQKKRMRHQAMAPYDVLKANALDDLTRENAKSYKALLDAALVNQTKVRKQKTARGAGKNDALIRASENKQPAADRHFLRSFGQANKEVADGGTTEGGIPQVLMLMNGKAEEYFSRGQAYIYQQAEKHRDIKQQYDSLYQSFLGRKAKSNEMSILKSRRVSLEDLSWILLNTREFIFIQ